MNFFSRPKAAAASAMDGDEILPFHLADRSIVMQQMLREFSYRFDDVLDYHKLRTSFERLLEIGDWRKLGARVRVNHTGQLEYHLPRQFTEKRPGVVFTNTRHSMKIDDHPVASQMPRSVTIPTVFGDPDQFLPVVLGSKRFTSFEDWTKSDRPPITVHVGSFTDATIVTICFSHTLLDALGLSILLNAWRCVLSGREQDVPPFLGFTADPFRTTVGRVPAEKHLLYNRLLGASGFILLIFSSLLEIVRFPKQEIRKICIPDKFVKLLRAKAMDDLRAASPGKEVPFLSEGDVMFAWWSRVTCAAQKPRMTRPVRLGNFFNFRGILDEALPPGTAYLGNAISCAYTFMTAVHLLTQPLGVIALELRQSLAQQRQKEQVESTLTLMYRLLSGGKFPIFAPHNALRITWTNWHKARFFDMDFSAAISTPTPPAPNSTPAPASVDRNARKPGVPTFINLTGRMTAMRNAGPLFGRDGNGNWWLQWTLRTDAWPAVEASLRRLGEGIA